ncbi:hypothetical protein OGY35_08820 [Citrobacter sp. Ct235]|uniref:hypothetical protein n=1 Tax=Citrobacter sp. Ct235 TaxID=2985157 RepID=UPI0015BDEAA2|nr:hypothetical protein [Citrobacter sp. Ct235]MDM2735479.1 hypothetical protein [Citrobacter sp. Ct235]
MAAAVVPALGERYQPFFQHAALNGRDRATRGLVELVMVMTIGAFANASDMTLTSISHLEMIMILQHFSHGEI